MKLLINASTLSGTGVTQVAVSFITECINIPSNEYHVFLSKTVSNEIDKLQFPNNFFFYLIESHPLYGLKGFQIRKKIKILEKKIKPDCVFSVFGPSYWTPSCPHLMGYAYPHYVYPESPLFKNISFGEIIKRKIFKVIHTYFLKRNGNHYVCETEDVSQRLTELLNCNKNNVFTATNTYNNYFNNPDFSDGRLLPIKEQNEYRFLSLCSFAPHKNITILNKVVPLLNKMKLKINIKFVLTIDELSFEKHFEKHTKDSIINIGRIDVAKCPKLYYECDALFLPTTLECFSANYPEAMKMKRPILTSNLSFATTVCKDAALYFDPYNENEIVSAIITIVNDLNIRENLIRNGEKNLSSFLTSKQRTEKYLQICESMIK
ncbi:glycosyltransferase [Flavobacterium sp. LS1R47]|uniref:Glycosyltransferase n=1 Tax=Flavobacterium frigoritolerans TaxID=2987686 RepID=A0A9X3C7F4_9FLAO|nr:glycosyltransferase [Flavobacterium frigoritolerans]MCV9931272.1 glycosyltransferase [Flavobacterium frigoritolerans]